ncbi:hypothetical protein VTN02DRAFT_5223 [Thermoascus thermophilus]
MCLVESTISAVAGDDHRRLAGRWTARQRCCEKTEREGKTGGRVHDLMGTRCDPYVNLLTGGETFDFHCHSNLTRAAVPFGLMELDVHDVLNVFQVTGLDEEGRYFMETYPAKEGDCSEFFAEVDVLCALCACPGWDLSTRGLRGERG